MVHQSIFCKDGRYITSYDCSKCGITFYTEIFKALHGSTPIYFRDLFEKKDKIYNLCSTVSLKQPKCNTVTYGLNSFRYKGAKIWIDLPNKIKNSITLAEFKNQIKKWQ